MTHTDLDYGESAGVQLVEERGKDGKKRELLSCLRAELGHRNMTPLSISSLALVH